jgi:FAD/FMN-containing dehydrogenase
MQRELGSWGRFPYFPQTGHEVHWRSELPDLLSGLKDRFAATLAFGNGRSYGDCCLSSSDHVIHTRALDRFAAADWTRGILTVEAGVTLDEILRVCVPRGWFLPVVPGTKYVTVGGALANDIHGKNHHLRGTFGRHVERFGLLRSDRGRLQCSAEENSDLYRATIGGLGLTGIIEWAALRLVPIRSSLIDVTECRYGSLSEFFDLSSELDGAHEHCVAWVDCLSTGASAGRGIYSVGNHAAEGPLTDEGHAGVLNMAMTPPVSLVNGTTLKMFNTMYYRGHRAGRTRRTKHFDPFFFPLDRIGHWNRLYGPKGFQQFQCVIPERNAREAVAEMIADIARAATGSFLAVMKRCGNLESPGLMSFPLPGTSLALDFPQHHDLVETLFSRLDAIVRTAGGRFYPAKDAHMSASDFRRGYPAWTSVEALRDPALNSRFWQRVTGE